MEKIRVISVYPNFANQGGAQDVALQLAKKLNENTSPIILTETKSEDILPCYKCQAIYVDFCWKSVCRLAESNTVFLSHHRKNTSLLQLYGLLLGEKLQVIHVSHNTFTNLRYFCLFPNRIVAVSNGVKKNLIDYFRISAKKITVILNGQKDLYEQQNTKADNHEIHILLPGRICEVKQQVEIVKRTRGKLADYIHIYFAGEGDDVGLLKKEIENEKQYHYIGFIKMPESLNKFDYVCLYSKNEGLGLSLIEGLMFGKPLITNKLLSVLDVNKPDVTGYAFDDFVSLVDGLNALPFPNSEKYLELSRHARLRFETLFTEERMIEQYRKLIAEVRR